WTNASAAPSAVQSTRSRGGHPLLGERIPLAGNAELLIWENEISLRRLPYLDDHRVQGAVIVPATAYMEMGLAAVVEAVGPLPLVVRAVQNRKPLFLRDGDTYTSQLTLTRGAGDEWHFDVYSRAAGQNWTHHVSGTIAQADAAPSLLDGFDAQAIMARCTEEIRGEAFYAQLAEKGNQWGPTFQGIENLWRGAGEALSFVRVPNAIAGQLNAYQIHPAVADSCGHVLTATISMQRSDDSRGGAFVGGGVDETRVYARPSGTGLWCYARLRPEADGQDKDVLIGDVAVYDEAGTLISETLGAKLWYLDRDAQTQPESVENWFYTLDWQPLEDQEITAAAGNWLLISEANTLAHEVAAQLAAGGGQALVVNSITEASAALAGITDLHGVIYLNAIKQSDIDQAATAPADVLALLQTALTMIWAQPPRIWLVTRGAQSILGEAPVLAQSPLWGFGRSVALEASEFWGGLIDLDPIATPEESARHIWQAVQTANTGEDQQAFREGQRFGARLVRQRLAATDAPFHARPDGSYLITGGLGGLGLALARWLAQHGARRLILMGRTALPPRIEWQHVEADSRVGRQIATIRELETLGVSVHLAAVDVGDEAQLRAYLDTYQAEGWPPIRGVIHAAGVMQYQAMQEHSPAEMQRIFQPKVQGGWLLHTLLPEVETFVMFSSVSSLLSSPLIGSYAAANTFLDALTYYRRAQGLPALTINWGAWGEVGMVADFGGADGSNQLMQPMSTENALDAFGRALRQPHPQVAVMAANWQRWEKLFSAMSQPPFLSAVMGQREPSAQPDAPGGFSLQSVLAAPEDERPTLIVTFLAEQSSRVMGFSGKTFDTSLSLSNLGMDSLMAVELKNRIETHLRVVVPMAQLLQGPSVDQLASIVLEQLAALDTSAVAAESADDRWEEGEL
ncbi:MAG: SDR family NAD(P)-dependent oxidoreductase, partial [Anaerolineae bacterium]|nr:SDR family NAD(P)-dependent oxidoreductase [Anaerolineae bacterium]